MTIVHPTHAATVASIELRRRSAAPATRLSRAQGPPARQSAVTRFGCADDARPALPDLERALINPAAVFAEPRSVLAHPRLMRGCKREILLRWAWDEYLKEVAASEGMAEGEPSRLDEVKAALLSLGDAWRPKPSAPASAVPRPPQDAERMAA